MRAECRNKNCKKEKEIFNMFYCRIPARKDNGEIIWGGFSGIYFCNSACWLVYKGVIEDAELIKKLKCKKEPTCDECFTQIFHLPVIYDHQLICQSIYASQIENEEGKNIKKCVECKVSSEIVNCKDIIVEQTDYLTHNS